MSQRRLLVDAQKLQIVLKRLAGQLVEKHLNFENTVLIGLQPRGVFLAERIGHILTNDFHINNLQSGALDITFFRDDFRRNDKPLSANRTHIEFLVEDKSVVFIDDVLYTGRSIRAALTAIQSFGRPKEIELLTLVDRRFSRHLPIQPDYIGFQVDAINSERVTVCWKDQQGEDAVYIEDK